MSLESIARKYSDLPKDQVRLLSSDADLMNFHRGVVLALHKWSGDAIVVLKRLSEVLHEFPAVVLGVVDGDALDRDALIRLGGEKPLQGYGDAFWISNGQVVATLNRKKDAWEELVLENTKLL